MLCKSKAKQFFGNLKIVLFDQTKKQNKRKLMLKMWIWIHFMIFI